MQTSSLLFKGDRIGTAKVSAFGDGCCEACAVTKGCAMWWASKDGSCEMFSLDKGPVTWSINYQQNRAGLMTSGPSALAERSSDCGDGSDVWLFKGIVFDGIPRASATDPMLEGGAAAGFRNGFPAKTWQECCKGAAAAPGMSLMERHYQYRGRQYFTWSEAEGKCYVKVRPFQAGATVLTMRRAPGVVSGMFGNEP